jgi:hypothetical protein
VSMDKGRRWARISEPAISRRPGAIENSRNCLRFPGFKWRVFSLSKEQYFYAMGLHKIVKYSHFEEHVQFSRNFPDCMEIARNYFSTWLDTIWSHLLPRSNNIIRFGNSHIVEQSEYQRGICPRSHNICCKNTKGHFFLSPIPPIRN